MTKATGFEIRDFYYNHFPEGYYYECYEDDLEIEDEEGNFLLEDNLKYDLKSFGSLIPNEGDTIGISFSWVFIKYKKSQTVDYLIVEVPKDKKDKAVQEIKGLGYKVK